MEKVREMASDSGAYICRSYDDQKDTCVSPLELWVAEVSQGHHAISTGKIKFFFSSRS